MDRDANHVTRLTFHGRSNPNDAAAKIHQRSDKKQLENKS
jgi:hypothetical protein